MPPNATWKNRIGGYIHLVSPSGLEFDAKYIEDERTKSKRLQITTYLGIDYSYVRDLGIGSPNNPVILYFDGNDCDKNASKFWNACDESGQWGVTHPVHGFQSLQLVSVTQHSKYVTGGGVVEFTTEWIEPKNIESYADEIQLKTMAEYSISTLNDDSAMSFAERLKKNTEYFRKNVENLTEKYTAIIDKGMSPIAAISDSAFNGYLTIKQSMNDFRFSTETQAISLAGQFQNFVEYGVSATNETKKVTRESAKIIDNIFKSVMAGESIIIYNDDYGKNNAVMAEMVSLSVLSGICTAIINGNIDSFETAIYSINSLLLAKENIINNLETLQSSISNDYIYTGPTVDNDYISNETTIKSIDAAIYSTIKYVMKIAFGISARKSIVIDKPCSTIVYYIKTYRKLTGFEDFCERNKLYGSEVFWLPYGRNIWI